MLVVKDILQGYERLFRQAINLQKSGIFFCTNVDYIKQQELKDILGVQNDLGKGHYLGLPSLIDKSNKVVFKILRTC